MTISMATIVYNDENLDNVATASATITCIVVVST